MCSCEINHANVDEESFTACNNMLSEYVTFQARLSGTSDYDSEYLASLLVKWVSTSPSIFVNGLQMEISNDGLDCPTVSSDIVENCLNKHRPSSDTSTNAITIAASVMGIFIFVCICCFFIICLCYIYLVQKKNGHNYDATRGRPVYVIRRWDERTEHVPNRGGSFTDRKGVCVCMCVCVVIMVGCVFFLSL